MHPPFSPRQTCFSIRGKGRTDGHLLESVTCGIQSLLLYMLFASESFGD